MNVTQLTEFEIFFFDVFFFVIWKLCIIDLQKIQFFKRIFIFIWMRKGGCFTIQFFSREKIFCHIVEIAFEMFEWVFTWRVFHWKSVKAFECFSIQYTFLFFFSFFRYFLYQTLQARNLFNINPKYNWLKSFLLTQYTSSFYFFLPVVCEKGSIFKYYRFSHSHVLVSHRYNHTTNTRKKVSFSLTNWNIYSDICFCLRPELLSLSHSRFALEPASDWGKTNTFTRMCEWILWRNQCSSSIRRGMKTRIPKNVCIEWVREHWTWKLYVSKHKWKWPTCVQSTPLHLPF